MLKMTAKKVDTGMRKQSATIRKLQIRFTDKVVRINNTLRLF